MAEFSIIEEFCHGIGPSHADTTLSVGDDAAVISVPIGMQLAISVDTMVADIHFYSDASPDSIAHKLFAVNLSDMAAMGAIPKWATVTLSLPDFDRSWLRAFSDSLKGMAKSYSVQVIGGDTTQGPLNLSMNIMGLCSKGEVLTRCGANVGDDVYVSHVVGDAALGLLCVQNKLSLDPPLQQPLIDALEKPTPRVELGRALIGIASSCLDVSDGLVGDLTHICERSEVSIELDIENVPLSKAYVSYMEKGGTVDLALNGGDDYELAFTANAQQREVIEALSEQLGISLTKIGQVKAKAKSEFHHVRLLHKGQVFTMSDTHSFEHFS